MVKEYIVNIKTNNTNHLSNIKVYANSLAEAVSNVANKLDSESNFEIYAEETKE